MWAHISSFFPCFPVRCRWFKLCWWSRYCSWWILQQFRSLCHCPGGNCHREPPDLRGFSWARSEAFYTMPLELWGLFVINLKYTYPVFSFGKELLYLSKDFAYHLLCDRPWKQFSEPTMHVYPSVLILLLSSQSRKSWHKLTINLRSSSNSNFRFDLN